LAARHVALHQLDLGESAQKDWAKQHVAQLHLGNQTVELAGNDFRDV
jgi:hypothetical protein